MGHGFTIDTAVLLGGLVVAAGVVATVATRRYRVPGLLLFMALGAVVADDGLGLVRFDDAHLAQNVAVVALAVILFEGGLASDRRQLRAVAAPAVVLATGGVVVTAGLVATAAVVLLGLPFGTAALLGAIVASTDAAAVFDVLRDEPMPSRLRSLLHAESGGNDPVAVLLTVGITETALHGAGVADWVAFGLRQVLVGVAGGLAVGSLARGALRRLPRGAAASGHVLVLASAAVAYGLTASLHGSGFLAVYLAGLVVADQRDALPGLASFHEGLASTAQAVLFVMLGLLVFPSRLVSELGAALLVTGVLVLVARPVAVAVCLAPFRFAPAERAVVSWAGLRGAVPIVLATVPLAAGHPRGGFLFDVVFVTVVASLVVQAPTVGLLTRRLADRSRALAPPGDGTPAKAPAVAS